jgi:hypothetical protein
VSRTYYLINKLMDTPTMFSMEFNLLIDKTLARICLVIHFILTKRLSEFLGFLLLGLLCKMKDYQPSICNSVCYLLLHREDPMLISSACQCPIGTLEQLLPLCTFILSLLAWSLSKNPSLWTNSISLSRFMCRNSHVVCPIHLVRDFLSKKFILKYMT